jgi:TRAP-type C4-dicarboxylate transport system substrate-binding protein
MVGGCETCCLPVGLSKIIDYTYANMRGWAMKFRRSSAFAILVVAVFLAAPASGLNIKMGCMAPASSPWGIALNRLAGRWARISNGQVRLKLYLGGIAGREGDMLRKMRFGQLHAAAVTALGLGDVAPELMALNLPFFIKNEKEYRYVLNMVKDEFEEKIASKGFTVLGWSFAGWVHLFAREPVIYPDDLKGQRLAIQTADADILNGWRDMGFNAVVLSAKDLMMGLQSGMVDAFYSPPMIAAAFQWFSVGQNMSLLKVLPIYGAVLIKTSIWKRVPEKYRDELIEAVAEAERIFAAESGALEEKSMKVMKEHGLVVHEVPQDAEMQWRDLLSKASKSIIGNKFSIEFYRRLQMYLEESRAQ